ncbi:MAG: hypothetical protein UU95_C0004G0010 [Parcubacteria group bacterium GW2011_GWC2_42_12]|uniref:EamA domain-containing protein n=2 Tax=Candidatus Falkowiibacteriota TaxID=1752728 RepID=A0A1F5S9S9_9BACT|nr:MAG: hypothetical protein UU43_C0003G0010 [Candidatus Falkowbacteria bacterium GW2011_GWA2_41_14]KKS35127.1 MAG: hypothetical protein UU95_C0004G0010 [Parcubacteria group bacterium GW2011_GWC2_42_12]OGF23366.1 MAG: hypothetical protein A3D45_03185 [Candidatus Falkowbacteria bacterium RIFCSPHIGHO2_02_FULL_42_9]
MFGVIIVFLSSFFVEISDSVSKLELKQKQIGLYSLAVVNSLAVTLIFIAINIYQREFIFSPASLPIISIRAILEIILTYLALTAIAKADRSTHGFIRILTMPLLLLVDFSLGYQINSYQLAGIGIIIFSLFLLFSYQGIKKQGAWLSLATAVLAVATISLYKYDITHYNSVAAEQTIMHIVILIFLLPMAFFKAKENPFSFFKQKIFCFQSLINVIPSFLNSYAYAFAPASVILSAYRSSAVLWSVVSGKIYFHEKHLLIKAVCLILLVGGIILLAI